MPKVGFATFIWSLVLHAFSASGSLGHHVRAMSGGNISDASAHERRQGLGWDWFEAFFETLLQPLARRAEDDGSFYHGMRLLGVDDSRGVYATVQPSTVTPSAARISRWLRFAARCKAALKKGN